MMFAVCLLHIANECNFESSPKPAPRPHAASKSAPESRRERVKQRDRNDECGKALLQSLTQRPPVGWTRTATVTLCEGYCPLALSVPTPLLEAHLNRQIDAWFSSSLELEDVFMTYRASSLIECSAKITSSTYNCVVILHNFSRI
ncbi:hypothetical protein TcWFU_007272 [Taenia crassiceps]|uniref:Uncharacterized protein n=1 Tax=Taenia crassiceps TaxID=6207 RepID=A0ABR4Q4P2_9CEST